MSELFRADKLCFAYNGCEVLHDVSLDFGPGRLTAIAGPNGAGKSTLLGVLAGLRAPYGGACLYGGCEVRDWQRRAFAREVSFVPQSLRLEFPFQAEQVVMMGRTPFCDGMFESPADHDAVERAMAITDTLGFRGRDFRSLSGGERQRVVLASALAQSPRALLLDEPTTFLDLEHQVSIYRLLGGLCAEGMLVVTVTHDLNLAAAFCERLILLRHGRVAADASPAEVLDPGRIRDVFRVETTIHRSETGKPWIRYGD